jgi:acyl-homoserine lactone acylase PvdQ
MVSNTYRTAKVYLTKIGVKTTTLIGLLSGVLVAEEVTIYRDGWGVPHIHGDTDRAVAYGYGYAQTQDRLDAVLRNYAQASGRLALIDGPDAVTSDFQQRLWRHAEIAQKTYAQTPEDTRQWVAAFTAGVRAALTEIRRDPLQIGETDALTLARFLFWRAAVDQLDAEYRQSGSPRRDNGILWAVGPERSIDDAAVLVADPTESWAPGRRWYEAHLHGDTLHAWGFTYPGLPFPVYGHNRRAGWGWIGGGADVGDVYKLRFLKDGSNQYLWAGTTRAATTDTFHIGVKGAKTHILTGQRSHLGPLIHRTGRLGYSYRILDQTEQGPLAQLHAMLGAKSFRSFYDAIKPSQIGSSTILFGDTTGTLFYIRSGQIPIRTEFVNWDRPIFDQNADWLGRHIQEDLIQLVDPHAGWVADAGTPPDLVSPYSPLIPDRHPGYLYYDNPGRQSILSRRLHRLIRSNSRLTVNETFKIVLDSYVIGSEAWIRALRLADSTLNAGWTDQEKTAFDILMSWDGRAEPDRYGPALYAAWRAACGESDIDTRNIETFSDLLPETRKALVRAFRKAVKSHVERYGHLHVRWKEIHRTRRGGQSWGQPGIASPAAKSIRRIWARTDRVVHYATGGQSAPTVIVFDPKGIRSFSAVPYGQSDVANSPHSWDQADVLFTQNRLKPTRFDSPPDDLKKKEVLRLPEELLKN